MPDSESLHCPLLDLPNELLIIADKLALTHGTLRHLHSLLLTNRRFSLICTPLLIQRAVSFCDKNLERRLEGTVLHWAASKGYANLVERLLAAGIDADIPCRQFMDTPLERAAKCGDVNIMHLLISSGASVRRYRYGAQSPMVLAAMNGHISAIDVLIANGAYYNSREDKDWPWEEGDAWGEWQEGTRALHAAACNGHLDIVKKLLGYGASANAKDKNGVTALVKAAQRHSYDVVCFLASKGASISDTDRMGRTALHFAIRDHRTTERLCQPSILNVSDINGCTALHYACQLELPHSVKALLFSGANIEATTNQGRTPLIFVLSKEFGILQPRDKPDLVQVIEILLEHRANVNAVAGGLTALHYAALYGHVTIMQKLISSGASVRASKPGHSSPILYAAKNGHVAAIDILVANGAYFNAREEDKGWKEGDAWGEWGDGNEALHAAARGHLDAFRKLLSHGASTSAKDKEGTGVLLKAAQHAAYDIVSFLLSIGVSISEVDRNGNTALHLTIRDHRMTELLCHPSIINARNGGGLTALHLACRGRYYVRSIKVLLDCGTDIEAKNDEGQTPLIFTFAKEYEIDSDSTDDDDDPYIRKDPYGDRNYDLRQLLTTLLAGGANINVVDNDRRSALDHAVWWDHDEELEASQLLIEHGANPDGGDSSTTPLHTAQHLGHKDVVEYLLEKGANRDLLDSEGRTYLDVA